MNSDEFVSALVKYVHEVAVEDTLSTLAEGPSGRRPPTSLVELKAWFEELPQPDRDRLHQVVEQAVHSALFGVLCVLDGARPIEEFNRRSTLQLFATHNGESKLLNAEDAEDLHDLYQGRVYERVFGREP